MATGRWILSVDAINGTGCIHDCYASFHRPPQPSSSSSHRLFANVFIAAVCTAAAAFFLVLTYYTVLVSRRRVDRVAADDGLPSEADGSVADYHVWRIRTVGLDESTIVSIPTKPYITGGGGGTADCSVCLGEFRDGELVRYLPACDHAFHVSCIDTWLRAHINCPLCRAHVIVPADSGGGGSATMHPDGNPLITDRRVSGDLEDDSGGEIRVETVTDSTLDCPENSILRALTNVRGNKLQLVLRSKSIDSLTRRDLLISLDRDLNCLEERKEHDHYFSDEDSGNEKKGKQGSNSKGDCQLKCSSEIGGGSTSGSGRMFFLSRYGRARSSSVLPL
ncbi:hypothetical protein IEQ34_019959 [Dendrobium chrysotoxum]|uniref:RING-type E3 ubiquitin transferase n=1 Tax=Dendrobium chrysotoxum TaxID=161865 RepID=A0AAV7GA40_DENCH|nr:hypothetical protein IEQ34_019959 [Dendrobium chrysotoxum]